jgi:outer membrane protein assembly factor BamB
MIVDGRVFVYANDEVYGISRGTGTTIWNTSIPGDAESWDSWTAPAYNDGVLFVGVGYNLTRIDAVTGTVLQQIAFPDGGYNGYNGGPTVADGMVFAGSGGGGNYYAFDEDGLNTAIPFQGVHHRHQRLPVTGWYLENIYGGAKPPIYTASMNPLEV